MSKKEIGKLIRVSLKKIWEHEASDFTPYLCDKIGLLSEALGFELSDPEIEKAAGSFSADIVARDEEGGTVVIENQYWSSDHKHLGQLLTYMVAHEAKKAVWVMENPREEHIEVLSWLDEHVIEYEFYMVKAEAVHVDTSKPALLLTKIFGPNAERRNIQRDTSERDERLTRFSKHLLKALNEHDKISDKIIEGTSSTFPAYYYASSKKIAWYTCRVNRKTMRVELAFDSESVEKSNQILEQFEAYKEKVEEKFGTPLGWEKAQRKTKRCHIRIYEWSGGFESEESKWQQIIKDAVDKLVKLDKATRDVAKKLNL